VFGGDSRLEIVLALLGETEGRLNGAAHILFFDMSFGTFWRGRIFLGAKQQIQATGTSDYEHTFSNSAASGEDLCARFGDSPFATNTCKQNQESARHLCSNAPNKTISSSGRHIRKSRLGEARRQERNRRENHISGN